MEHLHRGLDLLHRQLLSGKLPRSVAWNHVVELVTHLGKVEPHGGGGDEVAFVVGSQRDFFKRPHGHDLDIGEVSRLRRFLKAAAAETAPHEVSNASARMVVVIDHHAARIFQDGVGNRPTDEATVEPEDPHGFHHHLIHRKESHYEGGRVPEDTAYYEDVAKELVPASELVLVGHGTGKSSAVDFLVAFLKTHHAEIARRVTAVEYVDLSALTQHEIEAIAKRHLTG